VNRRELKNAQTYFRTGKTTFGESCLGCVPVEELLRRYPWPDF